MARKKIRRYSDFRPRYKSRKKKVGYMIVVSGVKASDVCKPGFNKGHIYRKKSTAQKDLRKAGGKKFGDKIIKVPQRCLR